MRLWVTVTLVAFGLSGCGDSGLNPLGWFGGQSEAEVETVSDVTIVEIEDPRPRVPRVTSLRIDRTPGGALIRATGLPPEQGWHSAELVPTGDATGGILTFDFRAVPPSEPTRISTVQSRELVVAYPISNIALQGIRSIRVVGASNILTTRR